MVTWEATMLYCLNPLKNGGPGGFVFSYLFALLGVLMQTLVMAELSSMFDDFPTCSLIDRMTNG